uniref:Uncharacterized protein n=1 Tax=Rhizophora mucronata TaxID=61149 RepID=A0A2P2IUX7_RHIMU
MRLINAVMSKMFAFFTIRQDEYKFQDLSLNSTNAQ